MGAVCCTLEYGKAVKENFYHGNLSGEFVHYHGYGRYDFSYSHCFGGCYRKPLSRCLPLLLVAWVPLLRAVILLQIFCSANYRLNVAGHIQVSPDWLSAANTVGATGGKIISPQSIAIATSAGNQQGKEGEILKSAIPYALAYVVITGVIVYIFS